MTEEELRSTHRSSERPERPPPRHGLRLARAGTRLWRRLTPRLRTLTAVGWCSLTLVTIFAAGSSGCDDPCADLEALVCDELDDKHRCKLMQAPERRELLSSEACEGMLKSLKR